MFVALPGSLLVGGDSLEASKPFVLVVAAAAVVAATSGSSVVASLFVAVVPASVP